MAETFVSLRDVVVRYGSITALDIPELEIDSGGVLAIIGANGAGKSTLLRVMGLLQRVDRGVVAFPRLALSRDLLSLRRRIATVFQAPLLVNDSVFANVALGLRLRGVSRAEIPRRVMPWLERLGIGQLAKRSARTLSGGEAQRASLARALVLEPELLLLDEPFAGLDPSSREALLWDVQRMLKETALTVAFVTHDRDEAYALGQRIAVLDHGRLVQLGSRDEVFHAPAHDRVANLVGFENRLSGIVEACDGQTSRVAVSNLALQVPGHYAVGSRVILCIRASAVRVECSTLGAARPLTLAGKIKERFRTLEQNRTVVDCAEVELVSSADMPDGLGDGDAVVVALEASAIHVIAAADSHWRRVAG